MPTLAGMRRLGYTPSALRNFCESVGVSKNEGVVDIAMLEHAIREDLDASSPRVMCVLDPLRMVITNLGNDDTATLSLARHPKITEFGMRNVPFSNEILIDRADFLEETIPGFKRLVLGGEVRLRGSYVVRCDEIETDLEGRIQKLKCSADLATLGKKPEGRKVKGVIHWVSADKGVPVEVRLYDRLFNVEFPESKDVEDFTKCLNPNSLRVIKGCIIEPSIFTDPIIGAVQFEREGYFTEDVSESSNSRRIFNRTITLRNSWE
jgi:glutaminyl-tRNA synthetase